jgi:lysophospholipase L1-like esterase
MNSKKVIAIGCFLLYAIPSLALTSMAKQLQDTVEKIPHKLLLMGSSTIDRWNPAWFPQDFPQFIVSKYALSGSDFSYLLDALKKNPDPITTAQATKVVIYGGDNDLAEGRSEAEVLQDAITLSQSIHKTHPNVLTFILSVKICPARINLALTIEDLNQKLQASAAENFFQFVDTYHSLLDKEGKPIDSFFDPSDHLHLNRVGYAKWAAIIRRALAGKSR